jgi:transposase
MVDYLLTQSTMNKNQAIQLRKRVQFYVKQGMKKSAIARKLNVSRPFIDKWINSSDANEDNRGWEKGKKRKYTDEQEQEVIQKRNELGKGFFLAPKLSSGRLVPNTVGTS